ncbi:BTB/POZ domain-containing protein KCTD16 [Toxocara canis]|uniref:BTB/POZ domain-containing protein KCTD16 n=1 Tax=Toxocara canis TaxID=6265 RepID=A0A0B2UN83_TOXCA|nr:BTB/POZ domain-containing protein KCTD16 [Toxocara canis]
MGVNQQTIINFNVGGQKYSTSRSTLTYDKQSLLNQWFCTRGVEPPLELDNDGAYFIDRDPFSFGVILNYLRLKSCSQLWEACLPKDPDRLALLTQEAEYFRFHQLREQAVALLQNCTEKANVSYVNEVLAKSFSCPQGFDAKGNRSPRDD